MLERLKGRRLYAALAVVLAGGGIATAAAMRHDGAGAPVATAGPPTVIVAAPQRVDGHEVELPARLEPDNVAQIHARTTGYVDRWYVDIGQTVKAGQTLASLSAPELEQQLAQAQAELQKAEANLTLAETTAERWGLLLKKELVARQAYDEKVAARAAARSLRDGAAANVAQLRTLQGYTRIRAPFDGVITSRGAQIGALVSGGASGPALFTLADTRRLRVVAHVPQRLVGSLREGMAATLSVPESPADTFRATLARSSGAIDPESGAMRAEFIVDNASGRLKPGGYASLQIRAEGGGEALFVPATSLIVGQQGARLAVVDGRGRVDLRTVKVGRDEGRRIEILGGLAPLDRVVVTPPDGLAQGQLVTARAATSPARKEPAS